jgi:hypothetical protein
MVYLLVKSVFFLIAQTLDAFDIDSVYVPFSHSLISLAPGDAKLRAFMLKEIGDEHVQTQLEHKGAINFADEEVSRIATIRTTGDGNCLMHAACLAMIAMEDSNRVLRRALASAMHHAPWITAVKGKWTMHAMRSQAHLPEEFRVAPATLEAEWTHAMTLPTLFPDSMRADGRAMGVGGCSLLSVHVYILSQMLQRPIVVYADNDLAMAESGDGMGGLYLPVHAPTPHRSPLLLAYTPGHFTALVPFDSTTRVPLASLDRVPLSIVYDSDPTCSWEEVASLFIDVVRDGDGRPWGALTQPPRAPASLPAPASPAPAATAGVSPAPVLAPLSPAPFLAPPSPAPVLAPPSPSPAPAPPSPAPAPAATPAHASALATSGAGVLPRVAAVCEAYIAGARIRCAATPLSP